MKTNASSGGVDATEKEKAAAVLRQLFLSLPDLAERPLCRNRLFGIPHGGIFTAQSQELLMGSGLRYFSVCHDEDSIGIFL